jgi:single-strand DNA-binding protein
MYQQIVIVGNLGKDPEMRYTPSGTPVTSMNVATSRKYTGSDGQLVKETTWFRVSVFGKQAEACAQYLKKGSSVLVEGRLTPDKATGGPRTYTRNDGSAGASFEVAANTVRFMSSRDSGSTSSGGAASSSSDDDVPVGNEEEIPF